MKKISIVLLIAAGFALAGCGGGKSDVKKPKLFGFTCMDLTNPFFIKMSETLKAGVEANGDQYMAIDARNDQGVQNDGINDMISQGMVVLFLTPQSRSGVQPALEACKAAKVLIVNVDSAADDQSYVETFISANNEMAGFQCGQEMVRVAPPEGASLVLIESQTAESVVSRVKGIERAIAGTNVKIIDRKSLTTGMDQVLSLAEDLMTANTKIDYMWGANDNVALVILGAVEGAGRQNEIRVFGVDGAPAGKISVSKGGLWATAAQSPVAISQKAVECAYKLLNGETVEKTYSIDTKLINRDNVNENDPENWG